jgi:Protein of unknown function (DUF1656)
MVRTEINGTDHANDRCCLEPDGHARTGALLSTRKSALGGSNEPTRDIDLGGILVAPFVRYLFLALVIVIAVRFVFGRLGLRSMFANPPLAEAALYVCILVSLMVFWI